jgi:hypothetical protein
VLENVSFFEKRTVTPTWIGVFFFVKFARRAEPQNFSPSNCSVIFYAVYAYVHNLYTKFHRLWYGREIAVKKIR